LRAVLREIHPEVSFAQLAGRPMIHSKSCKEGKEERRLALTRVFPNLTVIENDGRRQSLPIEDILDATIACWSANRIATGVGRRLPDAVTMDSVGLPMAIWM
jgi:predicted RNase H-like nuclease